MKYSEEQLKNWYKPASDTEEEKINNAINMIKNAIRSNDYFNSLEYEIFVQGSYGNNTNVRNDSDVDINIMLKSNFFADYPEGKCDTDYLFSRGNIKYCDYKSHVIEALYSKFGRENIHLGNKSVKISSNTYRVHADSVISIQYRNYRIINSLNPEKYFEGIKYFSHNGEEIINYPKIHIRNGIEKNNQTNRQYKKLVRIFKRIRNKMIEDNYIINKEKITSFMIECLIYNVPNVIIVNNSLWNEKIRNVIMYLFKEIDNSLEWMEVSGGLYLFNNNRKWTRNDVKQFLSQIYIYMGYNV